MTAMIIAYLTLVIGNEPNEEFVVKSGSKYAVAAINKAKWLNGRKLRSSYRISLFLLGF